MVAYLLAYGWRGYSETAAGILKIYQHDVGVIKVANPWKDCYSVQYHTHYCDMHLIIFYSEMMSHLRGLQKCATNICM